MKIEKINDFQIRCILAKEDLEERHLRLAELAYGTDKAKQLFQDMMRQAAIQFGFHVENIPLMVEAIPMSGDGIVMIVTKVENPEELDTRFSSFAPSVDASTSQDSGNAASLEQLIESIRRNQGTAAPAKEENRASSSASKARQKELNRLREYALTHRLYTFTSLDSVIEAAAKTAETYTGESSLLFDADQNVYCLFLTMKDVEEVSRMQNVLAAVSEYGKAELATYARVQHLAEHCQVICADSALAHLAQAQ